LDKYDFISKENKILSDRIQQLELKKFELQNKVKENEKNEVKLLLEIGKKFEFGIDITKNLSEAMKYFKRAAEKGDSEGIDCYIRSICMKYCGDDSFEKEVSDLKRMIDSGNDYFISKYLKEYNHGFFGTVNPTNAIILFKSMTEQGNYLVFIIILNIFINQNSNKVKKINR
jgi:TPR repeat protein